MSKKIILSLILVIFYIVLNTTVYFALDNSRDPVKYKDINAHSPIHSIKGVAKESVLLTPNLEYPYKVNNFIAPKIGFGLEFTNKQEPQIVSTNDDIPIYVDKLGPYYSWFSISPQKNIPEFTYNSRRIPTTRFLDPHDQVLHEDHSLTMMEYVLDHETKSIYLALKRIDLTGKLIYSWDSRKHIDPKHFVQYVPPPSSESQRLFLKQKLQNLRIKYSQLVSDFVGSRIFTYLMRLKLPLSFNKIRKEIHIFDERAGLVDHIHANSMQYLDQEKYILISARHLDTIFILEVKTGNIIWSLGGPYSTFTKNRPIGDPRGGFSHQHDARVYKNKLYLFDNANMQLGLPSRAVVYTFDFKNPANCRYIYEYLEPYGRRRLSMGSIQPLDPDRILIGWGGVPLGPDRDNTSAAASIVNMRTQKTEWQLDFKPGWTSYRARAYQQ